MAKDNDNLMLYALLGLGAFVVLSKKKTVVPVTPLVNTGATNSYAQPAVNNGNLLSTIVTTGGSIFDKIFNQDSQTYERDPQLGPAQTADVDIDTSIQAPDIFSNYMSAYSV